MAKSEIKNKNRSLTVNSQSAPKRRGRRPKKILATENNNDEPIINDERTAGDSSIIVQMKIDPSKLALRKKVTNERNSDSHQQLSLPSKKCNSDLRNKSHHSRAECKSSMITDAQSEESSDGMFRNDIPRDAVCSKCVKHEKTINILKTKIEKYESKENVEKCNKIHNNNINVISAISGQKIPNKKDVWCMWDGHPFENKPFHLPEYYHNETYYVTGYFCSPNCALAHNLYYLKDSKVHQRRALVIKMYREMMGIPLDEIIELVEAPPREALSRFTGDMSIDQFRKASSLLTKEYIIYHPPIKPSLPVIEERPINNSDTEEKKYVLKRKTPLKKKNSVMSSMTFISSGSKTSAPKRRKAKISEN